MTSKLRTFVARAEIMFVLLAMVVFMCWQRERAAQRDTEAWERAMKEEHQRNKAIEDAEPRVQYEQD